MIQVFEKEPLTLEKDMENQGCFDMKWENYDINVVEWANIPKFLPLLTEIRRKLCYAANGMLNSNY